MKYFTSENVAEKVNLACYFITTILLRGEGGGGGGEGGAGAIRQILAFFL